MPVSVGAPRQLLRRLREVMAERESAQVRLDKVVVLIASNMVAEVCSLYLGRRDGSLELFATEGLNPGAVHNTHLKSGEGLVGLIAQQAEPMQFPDAQHHPAFSYRPETGEEIYHSFVGVPILRGGHTIGVLTVQNRTKRQYSDEEIEALQTTAMVLAEMIASGGLVSDEVSTEGRREVAVRFTGLPISEGVALGHVVLHEPRIVVTRLIAEDVELERRRLGQAIEDLTGAIDSMMERGDMARAGEHREVLEAFRMFAHDHGWRRRLDASSSSCASPAPSRGNLARAALLLYSPPSLPNGGFRMFLQGKRGLVVGVANKRSLAWGIAQSAAREGARLALTYQGERLEENVRKLAAGLESPVILPLDVTKDEELDALVPALESELGGLDFAVHAVAFALRDELDGEFVQTSREGYRIAQDVSSYSLTALTRRVAPLMTGGGSILTLSYLGGERVVPNYNVMGVAKAALEMSVRYLAADLGPRGIRVNAISAGPVKTLASSGVHGISRMLEHHRTFAPLRRNTDPAEVGDAAAFLLSDLARGITGEVLYVDSGYHILGSAFPVEAR